MNNNYFYNNNQHMLPPIPKVNITINQFSENRFVYVKQNRLPDPPKVLINPHFKKTVYINPNFNKSNISNKILVNPNVKSIHVNPKIHVNPSVLKSILEPKQCVQPKESPPQAPLNRAIVSTRTKLIRVPEAKLKPIPKRVKRTSIRTKYKIVKSGVASTKPATSPKRKNIYKVDNTKRNKSISTNRPTCHPRKKYVYVNRFQSISEIAKNAILKRTSLINQRLLNINGIMYKNSPNSLKKAAQPIKKTHEMKTKYKLVKKSSKVLLKSKTAHKKPKSKSKRASGANLKKCNIPCPVYRRYGVCNAHKKGKCNRKHDPHQIILCTKFLQGACLKTNCLLSHNVSPEKMPTCKYFLEGLCSKDDCPYLHVKISPKADICRDFLEGFCKKGTACEKRHQLLCPDYERSGTCPKKVCPYPHGNLVRITSVFRNFAKQCSKRKRKNSTVIKLEAIENVETSEKCSRYYVDEKSTECRDNNVNATDSGCDTEIFLLTRPKLGQLPAFIPFFDEK